MTTERKPGRALRRFARQILERRVVPWLLAYLAGGWVLVEATQFLTGQFGWPEVILRILPVVLGFGVASVITLAWFHGRAGWQKVRVSELAIHGAIATALGITLWTGSWAERPDRAEGERSLRRIAVLYFKDHTGGGLSRLTQDLTEGIIHDLAQLAPLDVLPLTAVAPYRDNVGLDRVVRELDVGTVIEGSVSQQGDSLLVTAQLVDAGPQTHFASWQWAVDPSRAHRNTARVADTVADSIRVALGTAIQRQEREARASNPAALRLYRRAAEIYRKEAATDWIEDRSSGLRLLDQADSLLARAEALDPGWSGPPLLRSVLAEDRSLLSMELGRRNPDDLRTGIEHASRALEAGTDSAAALERRGVLRFTLAEHSPAEGADSLVRAAERDLRTAIRLDGQRPRALMALSDVKERQGNFRSALAYARRAVEADAFLQFGSRVLRSQVSTMLQLEDLEGARELTELARHRFPTDQQHVINQLLILASEEEPGDEEIRTAWAAADTLAELGLEEREEQWRAYGRMFVACVIAQAGLRDSADAVIRRARGELERLDSRLQYAASYPEARARLRSGNADSALALLRHYTQGYPSRASSLLSDWWFRPLWDDPRFREITETVPVADGS